MSKHETPMLYWYWNQVGGILIEEFKAVSRTSTTGQRLIDGVIILDHPKGIARWNEVSLEGKDVLIIQVKRGRLGMNLMGQTFYSAKLIKRFGPRSVRSIALCEKYDDVLGPIFEAQKEMEVVIYKNQYEEI
jgi:hypothetical protein